MKGEGPGGKGRARGRGKGEGQESSDRTKFEDLSFLTSMNLEVTW